MNKEINEISKKLLKLESSVVVDVLDELGYPHQVISIEIRAISPKMKMAGPAFCIKGRSASKLISKESEKGPNPAYEYFRHIYPGCIAVVETGGHYEGSIIGENVGIAAKVRGCVGYIIDGGIRDTQGFLEMDNFSVFSRFIGPVSNKKIWEYITFEEPIIMPGHTSSNVVVKPGDFVLADIDGIVIIPNNLIKIVVKAAEELIRIEENMQKELWSGIDREKVYKKYDRFAHIKKLKNLI